MARTFAPALTRDEFKKVRPKGHYNKYLDYLQTQRADLQIVVALVPDLGASPSKKAAHPDPLKRALVTEATIAANARIAHPSLQPQWRARPRSEAVHTNLRTLVPEC